jgi:hypothetical protein
MQSCRHETLRAIASEATSIVGSLSAGPAWDEPALKFQLPVGLANEADDKYVAYTNQEDISAILNTLLEA